MLTDWRHDNKSPVSTKNDGDKHEGNEENVHAAQHAWR